MTKFSHQWSNATPLFGD